MQHTVCTAAMANAPLKKRIDAQNPAYLYKIYQQDAPLAIWQTIPESMRAYTIFLFVGSDIKASSQTAVLTFYRAAAKLVEAYNATASRPIWYLFQALNGETDADDHIDIQKWAELAADPANSHLLGFNGAELYNTSAWRGSDAKGNHAAYLAKLIELCGRQGLYFVWMDANRDQENSAPVMNRWLEERAYQPGQTMPVGSAPNGLLQAMKNHHRNVIMMNKESFGHPATDALCYGLWLAGYCDNWGTSSDWWHWGLHQNGGGQSWENIACYPEAVTAQSLLRAANFGAACYSNEAPWFTSALTDPHIAMTDHSISAVRLAGYQFAILPFFERLLAGDIHLPTKRETGAGVSLAALGHGAWNDFYMADASPLTHCRENGDIFAPTGRYGLPPILPANIDTAQLAVFKRNAPHARITEKKLPPSAYDAAYRPVALAANTYLNRVGPAWWWYAYQEWNGDLYLSGSTSRLAFRPGIEGIEKVELCAQGHCYGVCTEKAGATLSCYFNNYQTEKSPSTATPPKGDPWWEKQTAWPGGGPAYGEQYGLRKWIYDYLSVALDQAGRPLTEGETVLTAAGTPLQDRTKPLLRTSAITLHCAKRPSCVFKNRKSPTTRPYQYTETWDQARGWYTITLVHNGQVEFEITTKCAVPGKNNDDTTK